VNSDAFPHAIRFIPQGLSNRKTLITFLVVIIFVMPVFDVAAIQICDYKITSVDNTMVCLAEPKEGTSYFTYELLPKIISLSDEDGKNQIALYFRETLMWNNDTIKFFIHGPFILEFGNIPSGIELFVYDIIITEVELEITTTTIEGNTLSIWTIMAGISIVVNIAMIVILGNLIIHKRKEC